VKLPPSVAAALDGRDLRRKLGVTLLVNATAADGWPRIATLSVGEALAQADEILLSLYATSRTAEALAAAGKGLLMLAADGGLHKLRVRVSPVAGVAVDDEGRRILRARVEDTEFDAVPYARVTSGVTYELDDADAALARWTRQLNRLREYAR